MTGAKVLSRSLVAYMPNYKPQTPTTVWCSVGGWKGWEIRLDAKLRLSVWRVELVTEQER